MPNDHDHLHEHDHEDHDHAHDHDHDHPAHDEHDHDHDDHDHDDAAHAHAAHAHGHGHHHHHAPPGGIGDWRYLIGIGLNLAFVVAEAIAGVVSNSTALFADASHNLSDVMGLALAGGAVWLAKRPSGEQRTYGFGKATVFAALINGLLLVFASGAIVWEAIHRFLEPAPVQSVTVMVTAGLGVLINGATALMFMRGREHDANVKAAFLHMAADAMISVGVIVAGVLVMFTGAEWIDPLASMLIVVVILLGTLGLLRDAIDMALDAAPRTIDVKAVRDYLCRQPGVAEVHDLHIWAMGASSSAMTAHLVMPQVADNDAFLQKLCRTMERRFRIEHATFQIERKGFDCHPDHH
jgi:cobalt-zinc-cadmium efflux system protein